MTTNPESTADAPVRPSRPNTIRFSLYALAARGVCSVLAAWSLYGARGEVRTQLADANKTKGWTNADLNHQVDAVLRASMLNAGLVIILLALVAKFVWDGRAWGRWVYLALIVLLAQDENAVLGFFSYHYLLPRILTGLTGVFGLASLVLLFLPASNAYFRPLAGTGRSGGLFGALVQSRVRPGAPPAAGKGTGPASGGAPEVSLTKRSGASWPGSVASPSRSSASSTVSSISSAEAGAAPARSGGPRGKSRQAPPKRPGGR